MTCARWLKELICRGLVDKTPERCDIHHHERFGASCSVSQALQFHKLMHGLLRFRFVPPTNTLASRSSNKPLSPRGRVPINKEQVIGERYAGDRATTLEVVRNCSDLVCRVVRLVPKRR